GDLLPAPFSASHSVHEYGGRSYLGVSTGNEFVLYFSNKSDQRIYRMTLSQTPVPITPDTKGAHKYAEMILVRDEIWCVREIIEDHSCKRDLVAISKAGELRTLVSGHHFYMNPRVSPDGKHLIWVSWEHPLMPWDGTELFLAEIVEGEIRNK
ncbi:MAG: S9 family peptidase, partial [Actinomycetota bacterium]